MVELFPHQEEALEQLGNGKILWGDVGSGKSMVAAAYYCRVEADADIYVITTAKKRDKLDWQTEFAQFGVGRHRDATVYGGILTVDSWNNIGKYRDVVGAFFIFDEQRLVGSGDWTDSFIRIARANRWILLSATPGDSWMDYIPVFIANGFYKNRTEFKREHVVYAPYVKFPKVDRYTGVDRLRRLRDSILVEMPFVRKTQRHSIRLDTEYDPKLLERVVKDRWNPFKDEPLRDVAEMFHAARRVVNSDSSRLEVVRRLMTQHARLIVFYNFDYELEALRTLGSSGGILDDHDVGEDSKCSKTIVNDPTSRLMSINTDSTTSSLAACHNDPNLKHTNTVVGTKTKMGSPTSIGMESGSANHIKELGPSICNEKYYPQFTEWNGHKHQEIPKSDRWVYLVQYVAGAEGWNCIDTDATVFFSLPYSYKIWHQAHGRIDRLNTPFIELWYYRLMSTSFIDKAIWRCLEQKRNFNESAYVRDLSLKL